MTDESAALRDARIDVSAVFGAVLKRLPRIVLVSLALLAITFVVLMLQPRLYESSASILVEPRANVYMRPAGEPAPATPSADAGVVSSQIELLKSRDTLLKVIDQLDLRSEPEFNGARAGFSPLGVIVQLMGRRAAPTSIDEVVLNTLYDRLTVVQERDSRIISVLVRSTDPQLAARIANAVANAHVARRTQLSLSDTAEASGWLREEIARLRLSVQDAESAVAQFKVDNDLFTGPNNTSLVDQRLSTIASQISAAQERRSSAEARALLIRGLIERGQPIDGVSDVRESTVIQQLSEEKARLQGEKAQQSATLLPNHPTIRALTAQIGELDSQIKAEGRRVADALDAEAQIEAGLVTSLQGEMTRAKTSASTATRDGVTLDSLEREAKAQRDLLESYLARYNEASSKVDANSMLPDVRVVSVAAPSVSPASPKTTLVMAAVGLFSVALQVGAVIFGELMSGRAIVEPARSQDELEAPPFDAAELEPDQTWDEAMDAEAEEEGDVLAEAPEPVVTDAFEMEVEPVLPEVELEPALDAVALEPLRDFIHTLAEEDEAPVERPAAAPAGMVRYQDLAADLVLGRTHLLLLADQGGDSPSRVFAEDLAGEALAKGLSVALVDAGSGRRGALAGLTDLSTGAASFGDVVQQSADNSFAEVAWGQGGEIDRASPKPVTLVEALGDIYEVVLVLTGPLGRQSMLPGFLDLGGRVVLVAGPDADMEAAANARSRLMEAGVPLVEIAALPQSVAA